MQPPPPEGDRSPELAALVEARDEAVDTVREFARLRRFIGVAGVVGLVSTWAVWELFSGTARGLLLLAGLALFFMATLAFFAWSLSRAIADARRRADELELRIRRVRGAG